MLVDQYEVGGQLLPRLFVSARSGEGLDELRRALAARLVAAQEVLDMTPVDTLELPDALS